MEVERWNEARDGKLSESAMRRKMEARGYRVSRYVYPPGTVFPPHTHAVDKIDGVLSGRFELEMGGATHVLEAGDMIAVPAGEVHAARVLGEEPVVSLDAVRSA